jgi:hypothetical protein
MMRRRLAHEHGQGILEFAVIFPIFVLLIFVVIDGGILMGRYNNINHAAKEGARLAATGADDAEVMVRTEQQPGGLLNGAGGCGSGAPEVCVEWSDGPNGEPAGQVGSSVKVTVKYRYGLITPIVNWLKTDGFDVTSCAVTRLERPLSTSPAASGTGTC